MAKKPTQRRVLLSYIDGEASEATVEEVIAIVARSYDVSPATVRRLIAYAEARGWVI